VVFTYDEWQGAWSNGDWYLTVDGQVAGANSLQGTTEIRFNGAQYYNGNDRSIYLWASVDGGNTLIASTQSNEVLFNFEITYEPTNLFLGGSSYNSLDIGFTKNGGGDGDYVLYIDGVEKDRENQDVVELQATGLSADTTYDTIVVFERIEGGIHYSSTTSQFSTDPAPPSAITWTFNNTLDDVESLTSFTVPYGTEKYAVGLNSDMALNLSGNTKLEDSTYDYRIIFKQQDDFTRLHDNTIAFWYKPAESEILSTSGWLFMTQAISGPESMTMEQEIHKTNYELQSTANSTEVDVLSGWTDQVWQHFAMRTSYYGDEGFFEVKQKVEIFKDGVFVSSGETSIGSYTNAQNSIKLFVGGEIIEGFVGGLMQYLHIYNSALSDADILALYNNQE